MEIQKFNEMSSSRKVTIKDNRGRPLLKVIEHPDNDYISICDDNYCIRIPKYLVDDLSKTIISEK